MKKHKYLETPEYEKINKSGIKHVKREFSVTSNAKPLLH